MLYYHFENIKIYLLFLIIFLPFFLFYTHTFYILHLTYCNRQLNIYSLYLHFLNIVMRNIYNDGKYNNKTDFVYHNYDILVSNMCSEDEKYYMDKLSLNVSCSFHNDN